ncbi:hypothetical protein C487_17705 [Natrinema pallidum DSM 3751]|uniref:Uncharacterized protein n=1 Tax=Natrinema pallidum DSM 3751 TaxID=1227495 RepID=L9YHT1_9EURY|nr:hypothetical protein C487_17705 [Natrinema pallidum DSM 3751]
MTKPKPTYRNVGTVTTRDQNGSIVIPVQDAVDQSGNAGGNGIVFHRDSPKGLTGEVVDNRPDGRRHELARAINEFGSRSVKSVAIPPAGLEHLDIDRSDAADGVELDLWVCNDPNEDRALIAVTPVVYQEMQITTPERDSE